MISKISSLNGVKDLFVTHGEKLVVAGIGVLMAFLIWAAIGQPRIESSQQPEALQSLANAAKANINSTSAEVKLQTDAFEPTPYQEKLKTEPLVLDDYLSDKLLNPRIWAGKTKREDPELLPVAELEARGGFGAIRVHHIRDEKNQAALGGAPPIDARDLRFGLGGAGAAPQRKSNAEGRRWALIVGLVPNRKQIAEFERVFVGAEGFNRRKDQPEYLGYLVERREVVEGKPSKWQRIATFHQVYVQKIAERWAGQDQEVVERRFVNEKLTHPLPPLVPDGWDEQVTHSKVPLDVPDRDLSADGLRGDEDENPQPFGGFGGGADDDARRQRAEAMRRERRQLADGGRDMADRFGRRFQSSRGPKNYLLRFFDFEVEPGRKYQYRIKLVLIDPNYGVEEKFLAPKVIERPRENTWVIGPPSKPSPVVVIPHEATVLAGPAKAVVEGRYNSEPKSTVLLRKMDMKTGDTVEVEHELHRGGVGNFDGKVKIVAIDKSRGRLKVASDHKLNTNVLLLDIHGGEKISSIDSKLTQSGELLFMDAAGNFFVRDELEDASELQRHRNLGRRRIRGPAGRRGPGGVEVPGKPLGQGDFDRDQRNSRPEKKKSDSRPRLR